MKVARFFVTTDLLRECLSLPTSTHIRLVNTVTFRDVEIIVSDPSLRDVMIAEGEKPPLVCPLFRKQEQQVVFVDWGQK